MGVRREPHPFGHVPSVGIVVVVLQDHHGGDDGHSHDDHYAGKVLTWQRREQDYIEFFWERPSKVPATKAPGT